MRSFKILVSLTIILALSKITCAQKPEATMPSLKKVGSMQDNLILSIGLCNWISVPEQSSTETFQSREFGVLIMGERMISSGKLGLGFGLGFSSQNVHSDSYFSKSVDGSKTYMIKLPDEVEYTINKISLNFIDAQLELRLHTAPNQKAKRFKLSLGAKAGILLQSHTKYKDDDTINKKSGVSDLNKYQYGLISRLGYGNWAIGGYYSLVGIFQDDKGPKLVPYALSLYLTL